MCTAPFHDRNLETTEMAEPTQILAQTLWIVPQAVPNDIRLKQFPMTVTTSDS